MGERVAGRELDAVIAVKLFGWQRFPYQMTGQAANVGGFAYCPPGVRVHVGTIEKVPAFSTSIADAWMIVESRPLGTWNWGFRQCDDGRWFAEVRHGYQTSYSKAFPVWASTPALAISLAALACVESEALDAQGDAPEPGEVTT